MTAMRRNKYAVQTAVLEELVPDDATFPFTTTFTAKALADKVGVHYTAINKAVRGLEQRGDLRVVRTGSRTDPTWHVIVTRYPSLLFDPPLHKAAYRLHQGLVDLGLLDARRGVLDLRTMSLYEAAKRIGMSYNTAWHELQRLKKATVIIRVIKP